jgi:hypothetical protein
MPERYVEGNLNRAENLRFAAKCLAAGLVLAGVGVAGFVAAALVGGYGAFEGTLGAVSLLALVCGIGVILTAPYFAWMASSVRIYSDRMTYRPWWLLRRTLPRLSVSRIQCDMFIANEDCEKVRQVRIHRSGRKPLWVEQVAGWESAQHLARRLGVPFVVHDWDAAPASEGVVTVASSTRPAPSPRRTGAAGASRRRLPVHRRTRS